MFLALARIAFGFSLPPFQYAARRPSTRRAARASPLERTLRLYLSISISSIPFVNNGGSSAGHHAAPLPDLLLSHFTSVLPPHGLPFSSFYPPQDDYEVVRKVGRGKYSEVKALLV